MIEYQFEEEKEFAIFYAKKLERPIILSILNRGFIETREEAKELSKFFWNMVDKSIEVEIQGVGGEWDESSKFWTEKLLQTFSGYLEEAGYSDIWNEKVDKQ